MTRAQIEAAATRERADHPDGQIEIETCPGDASGRHFAFLDPYSGWRCFDCGTPMDRPNCRKQEA